MNRIEIKTTRKALAYALYGEKDTLEEFTQDDVDTLIKQKAKDLNAIYEHIDEEEYDKITTEELYSLGDVINLLDSLRFIISNSNPRELLSKIINDFKTTINANKNNTSTKKFSLSILKNIVNKYGLHLIDTHGLPFNGSTYKIVKKQETEMGTTEFIIGHFKDVSAIYANAVYCSFYDNTCIGANHLNGDESGKYIARFIMNRD